MSNRHLHARTAEEKLDSGRTQIQKYISYYRRTKKRTALKNEFYAYTTLWQNNHQIFGSSSQRVGNMIGRNIDEMLGRKESGSLLADVTVMALDAS